MHTNKQDHKQEEKAPSQNKKKNQDHEANPKHSCTPWCSLIERFWAALQTTSKETAKINQEKQGICKPKRLKRCCSLIATGTALVTYKLQQKKSLQQKHNSSAETKKDSLQNS